MGRRVGGGRAVSGRRIAPLRAAELPALAAALAPLPLFRAYALDAATLLSRWEAALATPGQTLLGLFDAAAPCGLAWYATHGTFGSGAYLRQLALAPGAQGNGDGARLLHAFEAAAATAPGGCFLLVSDFNAAAQRFYAAHGYRDVGALPGYARAGIVERIMWKRLTS